MLQDQVWRELLSPTHGLVDQSATLRSAVNVLDLPTVEREVRALVVDMSHEAQEIAGGIILYMNHVLDCTRGDDDAARASFKVALERFPEDFADLRRAGNLLIGLAAGGLPPGSRAEAAELVWQVFPPSDAELIMSRIRSVKPKLSARLQKWLTDRMFELQEGQPVVRRLQPRKPSQPSRLQKWLTDRNIGVQERNPIQETRTRKLPRDE